MKADQRLSRNVGLIVRLVTFVLLALLIFSLIGLAHYEIIRVADLTPQAYLPIVANDFPPLTPTPFATPVFVQRYQIEYGIQLNEPYVWMPVPRYWDGNGVRQVAIQEISPTYTDWYREENGTEIVYWENPSGVSQTFKVTFGVEIGFIEYGIDENREWPPYDTNSALYQRNITATTWVQVNHPEIQNQASSIVGSETNPYRKARLIHHWVAQNIGYAPGPQDALSTLRNRHSDCAGRANLFVALCRASGVPARNVAGIHNPGGQTLESGSWLEGTLHTHVWAEFYLPGYGWIQVDPGDINGFARIHEPRLVTSKGNDIYLGHGNPCGELSWFHIPYAVCQNAYGLWLSVTQLP
jgi:transglutaminase-like putative cysteine protease